ncbi:MAG: methylmalonyl-CoA mutase family protein [Phycisphaerae bacterium]|nr:methylmalonyl-CoA mutase family protein [Phycisphaerae bacterium]
MHKSLNGTPAPVTGAIGPHTTISGRPLKPVYGPRDVSDLDPARDWPDPGEFPFTRGVHPDMYRGKLWTMRQFAGFGTARQTNERFKFLLSRGQTGLSTAFDLPTLMGRDSDDPLSTGEVGRCGVAIDSLADFETLFHGIDLGAVSVSMTINAPAAILLAFYIATGDKQGVPREQLRGTCQNDILKEFHAQNEFYFPPRESVKLVVDTIQLCADELPQYNPVSISGYHIREAGSTAGQELAFTLGDGLHYVEACIERGMAVDTFAPRLSFFFNSHNDFFEEIAKFRAARRLWARYMRERFGAKSERSCWLRFHAQTAGCSLYGKQVHNNIVRVAYQAMAAVLGGCQSLHTNSMDETLALPSEHAVTVALRTQQILAFETGVTSVVDPLGGSFFIERLTKDLEDEAAEYIRRIDEMGGMTAAIESGYIRREIADAAFRYSRAVESKDKIVVGVNDYLEDDGPAIELLKIGQDTEDEQVASLRTLRARRDPSRLAAALHRVTADAKAGRNVMPALIDGAKAYATVGEMMRALETALGRYDGGALW